MKPRTTFLALGCFLTATGLMAQQAPNPYVLPTPTFSFGMIGVASGQTARLNVINIVRTPPPILIAQLLCKVELDLYDGQGRLLKQKTNANLGYGHADFIELDHSEIVGGSTRVEVTAVVKVGSNQSFFCSVVPTLEIFDDGTGHTTAILTSASTGPALIFGSLTPVPPAH